MENTNKLEMREILSVYEQGETMGTNRGIRAGMTIGAMVTLSLAGLVLAVLFGTGTIMLAPRPVADGTTVAPPLIGTGPIGLPPSGAVPPLVPGLPPAPAPDTQTIRPAPPSGLPRPARLPSD